MPDWDIRRRPAGRRRDGEDGGIVRRRQHADDGTRRPGTKATAQVAAYQSNGQATANPTAYITTYDPTANPTASPGPSHTANPTVNPTANPTANPNSKSNIPLLIT